MVEERVENLESRRHLEEKIRRKNNFRNLLNTKTNEKI